MPVIESPTGPVIVLNPEKRGVLESILKEADEGDKTWINVTAPESPRWDLEAYTRRILRSLLESPAGRIWTKPLSERIAREDKRFNGSAFEAACQNIVSINDTPAYTPPHREELRESKPQECA